MLYAVREHLRGKGSDYRIVKERWNSPYEFKLKLGMYELLPPPRSLRSRLAYEVLRRHKQQLGLIEERELDIVLDVSGFGYTDEWGPRNAQITAGNFRRWKRFGAKIVMLPQSFGPFSNPETIIAMKEMVKMADLVFPRDRESYQHLVDVVGECSNIRVSPDFTNVVRGVVPEDVDYSSPLGLIVPNHWLIKKVGHEDIKQYYNFLSQVIEGMLEHGFHPVMLLHSAFQDAALVTELEQASGRKMDVIDDGDPLRLKGLIGRAEMMVGSRFHALVGSLSQAVPTIGLGWSHKFNGLFNLYESSDFLLSASIPRDKLQEKLDLFWNDSWRKECRLRLERLAVRHERAVREMWGLLDQTYLV